MYLFDDFVLERRCFLPDDGSCRVAHADVLLEWVAQPWIPLDMDMDKAFRDKIFEKVCPS